ncbi:MAG: hypothetical protein IIT46_06540 [Lachnospiraceae bacterium]|jgi:hypothetical protein|nr:hypothetical protein [Lachnospiraceae bacterium]MBQ5559418.1 hypothetical protein [Lachnospiraceae bacterium]MCR4801570.1 hypothetical protein [Lachnospiraceae bacterium]
MGKDKSDENDSMLVIDENTIYEIDLKCLKCKNRYEYEELLGQDKIVDEKKRVKR